jgi:hypothetical protein
MKAIQRAALLGVLALATLMGSAPLLAVQEGAVVLRQVLTDAQMEDFLLNARIGDTKGVNKGVTNTRRATLSDDRITHDAQIQTVDISKTVFTPDRGATELNFKDSYRYNIAGYRLARLLGLENVPVSVERRVLGSPAAVTWWIDDVLMDEGARYKKQQTTGEKLSTREAGQIHVMRVFDALIANVDRNFGNLLWTTNGDMWMIDHTRAFRLDKKLKAPKLLERAERGLLEKLRGLTAEAVTRDVGRSLNKSEIEALLARRDEIVKLFDGMVAQRGEGAILYTLGPR